MSTTTCELLGRPACNFCGEPAHYDFKTEEGPWAYGCPSCYVLHRAYLLLGTGKGQLIVIVDPEEAIIQL